MAAATANPNHCTVHMLPNSEAARPPSSGHPWAAAEKRLNRFVRAVAIVEKMGNGLGTLAFTWATVVVLGGFSTDLRQDFWYATAIVFLEAFRVFSRESRSDDQMLFKTTGGVKLKRVVLGSGVLYYLNAVIVVVCFSNALVIITNHFFPLGPNQTLVLAALLALVSKLEFSTYIEGLGSSGRNIFATIFFRCIPIAALILLAVGREYLGDLKPASALLPLIPLFASWIVYNLLVLSLQHHEQKFVQVTKMLCTVIFPLWVAISLVVAFKTLGFLILLSTALLGNIQIPVAIARIVLSSMRLFKVSSHHKGSSNEHLIPALKIFYVMVFLQGISYIMACMLETAFSFLFRRFLAKGSGLGEEPEMKSINLYYEHAYDKCMQDGVLSKEDLKLVRFAVDSLNSNSHDQNLAAVRILYSLLKETETTRSNTGLLVSEITTSNNSVATLISMLGWTEPEDEAIRLFAAEVISKMAGNLRIVGIPGAMQMVSSLLDYNARASEVCINVEVPGYVSPSRIQALPVQETGNNVLNIPKKILNCVENLISIPKEDKEFWIAKDSFPSQALEILEKLAHDLDNCAEISRATGLIAKIIGFMSYTIDTTNVPEALKQQWTTSCLKLTIKLASTNGEIGIVLRQKISEQPFLLINLGEVLENNCSSQHQLELVMGILAKLAIDMEAREDIGSSKVFVTKLVNAFLGHDQPPSIRKLAGEALSVLSMGNAVNFCAALQEIGPNLIHLKDMLRDDTYTYVTASFLQNVCARSVEKLSQVGSSDHLPSFLPVVLEKILNGGLESKTLEALISLASQIGKVFPQRFAQELESQYSGLDKLVQKLVHTLSSSKKPSLECPRMRRVIVEMTICMLESCPHYAVIFREKHMLEALYLVERNPSKVEKYRVFCGNVGVVSESGLPLPTLVARAKGLVAAT
ncbi:unnamed protein product [Urochloa decumbens]|uniref:BLE2 protein n=1 Tax=Urochloa decumbens TaxID=240449 RepID=A0ABC8VYW3_9POAL